MGRRNSSGIEANLSVAVLRCGHQEAAESSALSQGRVGEPTSHPGLCTSGLTRFDLLGDFGRFNWLGNFYIVFLYNAAFAGLTTLCLVKTFTAAVRAELIRAFGERESGRGWWGGCKMELSGTVVIPSRGDGILTTHSVASEE